MPVIVIIIIAIYLILIVGTWHYLGEIEKNKKIIYIIIGIVLFYLITWIVYSISKTGIYYPNTKIENVVQNVIVIIFAGLNALMFLPSFARIWEKGKQGEIQKEKFFRKLGILVFIAIIILILESDYLKGTQQGILEIYQKAIQS